jgi:tetratricopeptide (TPR) repeat protein
MANPRSPLELADLYKKSAGMIVFERTSAATEAMLCGCPVIFCSSYGLEKSSIYYVGYDDYGIVWDFDQAAYCLLQKTIASFGDIYDARSTLDIRALKFAIDDAIDFFMTNESESVETTPTFNLGIANKYMLQSDIKNAVLHYKQLILDHPMNVETYFRMGDVLSSIGLLQAGLEVLEQGEAYLAMLPKHQILNEIRVMYYQKLVDVCHAIGEFSLERRYAERSKEFEVLDA